jgi:hypothetical protein
MSIPRRNDFSCKIDNFSVIEAESFPEQKKTLRKDTIANKDMQ